MTDYTVASNNYNQTGTADADRFFISGGSFATTINGAGGTDEIVANVNTVDLDDPDDHILSVEELTFATSALAFFISQVNAIGNTSPTFLVTGNSLANNLYWTASSGTSFNFTGVTGSNFARDNQQIVIDFSALGAGVTAVGPNLNTAVTGTALADTLTGGSKIDNYFGAGSSDNINGAGGLLDSALYTGNKANYLITKTSPTTVTVKDQRTGSPDGTDTLTNIEELRFSDGTIKVADLPGSTNHAPTPKGESDYVIAGGLGGLIKFNDHFSDQDGDKLVFAFEEVDANGKSIPKEPWVFPGGDFNTPAEAHGHTYNFRLTATDPDGASASKIIHLQVDDPPNWLVLGLLKVAPGALGQEGIRLKKSVSDADVKGAGSSKSEPSFTDQKLTFKLVGGPDKDLFTLGKGTGVLRSKTTLDPKKPSDSDHNNLYKVKVEVSDGFFSDTTTIKMKVIEKHHSSGLELVASAHEMHNDAGDLLLSV